MKTETLFAILIGLIGLGTAWLGLKAASAKNKPVANNKRSRVLSFTDPTIRIQSWNMRRIKWLYCLPSIAYVLFVALFLRNLTTTLISAVVAVFSIAFLAVLRDKPPSRTLKTADFLIKGSRELILQDCLEALEKIGAHVGRYDSANGLIEASANTGWMRVKTIVRIEATKPNQNSVLVRITSDSVQPSALFDLGANARNIRRFKAELV